MPPPARWPAVGSEPSQAGLGSWLFLSPLCSLSWSGDRRANPEEETAERVGGPEVRLRPAAGRRASSARLCSTLGPRAFLSASGPALQDGVWAPPFRFWPPKGQAGPQVSQTRRPLGVMPWPFTVVISEHRCFRFQTHKSDSGQLCEASRRRVKETQVAQAPLSPANRVSWVPSDFSVFPNVFFLFCFLVKTRRLVSLQERHPL